MNKDNFFISIGPEKTGTTWLYHNLNKHPNVLLPIDKEIRYFWAIEHLGKNNFFTNLFGKHWHFKAKREKFFPVLKKEYKKFLRLKPINYKLLSWHFKYFFRTQNDKWYESLFENVELTGDITPKYCELSDEYIERIKKMIPKCKIIISLRDPIQREWSRTKMVLLKNKGLNDINQVDYSKVNYEFNKDLQNKSNDYTDLIQKWKKHFPEEQVFIFHYDELKEHPQELFDRVCDFLNIPSVQMNDISVEVNKGVSQSIPQNYLNELLKLNYAYIEKYAQNHPNPYSKKWLEKYSPMMGQMD